MVDDYGGLQSVKIREANEHAGGRRDSLAAGPLAGAATECPVQTAPVKLSVPDFMITFFEGTGACAATR